MQWIRPSDTGFKRLIALIFVLLMAVVWISPVSSAEEKKLSVYAPQATYSLQVADHNNAEYAGVYEFLEPLGKVQLKVDGTGYRIRMRDVEGVFREGASKVRIGRAEITLPAKVVVVQGRVQVPVRVLPAVLTQYLKLHSELHESARRLFIENAGTRFSTEFKKTDGSLVLTFPTPVNPNVSTESGKVHLLFARDPVVFGADSIAYNDKLVSTINFLERNGTAEIVISGTSPLLASSSDGGRTITISAAPAPIAPSVSTATQAPPAQPSPEPAATSTSANATPPTSSPAAAAGRGVPATNLVHFFVMIDAGHGGTETGARFSDKLAEKEITLALARRLKTELQGRGVNAVLLRDSDSNITLDQRALASNSQRAGLYVSIHAGGSGTGVRVYTALMPSPAPDANGKKEKLGPFIPWESAQSTFLQRSRVVAGNVVSEMGNKEVNASMATAPLPPLNSIAAPAFAMEVAPPTGHPSPDALFTPSYQQAIAVATATAIVNARPKIEEQR